MRTGREINQKNLKRLCWANGVTVAGLARRIGKSRTNLYAAVRKPSRFPIIYAALTEELLGKGGAR